MFDDERLISEVEKYKSLYDKTDTYYDDVLKREHCWKEISKVMNEKEDTCRKKWEYLRETYRKSLRVRENREVPCRPGKFEKQMAFLKRFMGKLKRKRDDDREGSGDETATDQESNSNQESVKMYKTSPCKPELRGNSSATEEDPKQNVCHCSTTDPIMKFFSSMADSVKALPLPIQIKVKKEVLDIVSNAEMDAVGTEMK